METMVMTDGVADKHQQKLKFMNLLFDYLLDSALNYEKIAEGFFSAGWRLGGKNGDKFKQKTDFMNLLFSYLEDYKIDYDSIAEAFYMAGWRLAKGETNVSNPSR